MEQAPSSSEEDEAPPAPTGRETSNVKVTTQNQSQDGPVATTSYEADPESVNETPNTPSPNLALKPNQGQDKTKGQGKNKLKTQTPDHLPVHQYGHHRGKALCVKLMDLGPDAKVTTPKNLEMPQNHWDTYVRHVRDLVRVDMAADAKKGTDTKNPTVKITKPTTA